LGIAKGADTFEHGLPIEFAIIPMIIYLSSSIASSNLKGVYQKIGRYLMIIYQGVNKEIERELSQSVLLLLWLEQEL